MQEVASGQVWSRTRVFRLIWRRSDRDARTDAELLLATAGDVEAFGVFYRRHARWVLGFLVRRLGDAELAADVTSEVFAAAFLASARYDPARGASNSWLYGIATNQIGSAVRRGMAETRARGRLAMQRVAVDAQDIAWIQSLATASQVSSALELLEDLPEDQRSLITARVIDDRPHDELARERQLSETAVRKRVSRGLAMLRSRLQEEDKR